MRESGGFRGAPLQGSCASDPSAVSLFMQGTRPYRGSLRVLPLQSPAHRRSGRGDVGTPPQAAAAASKVKPPLIPNREQTRLRSAGYNSQRAESEPAYRGRWRHSIYPFLRVARSLAPFPPSIFLPSSLHPNSPHSLMSLIPTRSLAPSLQMSPVVFDSSS